MSDPRVWGPQTILDGALLCQKKYAEAEPLLLKGYEGLKQREKTIPPEGAISSNSLFTKNRGTGTMLNDD